MEQLTRINPKTKTSANMNTAATTAAVGSCLNGTVDRRRRRRSRDQTLHRILELECRQELDLMVAEDLQEEQDQEEEGVGAHQKGGAQCGEVKHGTAQQRSMMPLPLLLPPLPPLPQSRAQTEVQLQQSQASPPPLEVTQVVEEIVDNERRYVASLQQLLRVACDLDPSLGYSAHHPLLLGVETPASLLEVDFLSAEDQVAVEVGNRQQQQLLNKQQQQQQHQNQQQQLKLSVQDHASLFSNLKQVGHCNQSIEKYQK